MTTELIIAPPAAGKTTACIQRIKSIHSDNSPANIWVVVPDRIQDAAFRLRMADSGGGLGINIGTFGNLYRYILEHGGSFVPVASAPLLHRLVQETVERAVINGSISYFSPIQHMPGFILALRETFAELKRSLVYPEFFVNFSRSGTAAQKELALLYSEYQIRLKELNLADTEGLSWLAVAAMEQDPSAAAPIRLLVVDGFDSFNGAQYQALKILSHQVEDLLITFPGRVGSLRPAHRRFVESIQRLIKEFSPVVTMLDNSPKLPPDLIYIEEQLFEAEKVTPRVAASQLLLEARSPEEESREALRWIKKMVVRDKVNLSECAIFTPNPLVYDSFLRACAEEFGIPVHFTQSEPLTNSPALASLLNLLNLPQQNFNTRNLINILRSPYFEHGMSPEIVDELEKVSRIAQVVEGRDQWQETWVLLESSNIEKGSDLDDERILPGLARGEGASRLREILEPFFNEITPPGETNSQTGWINWLEDLLDRFGFYKRVDSERDQGACEVFSEILRAMVLSETIAGERKVNYSQFLTDLQGMLEGTGQREPIDQGKPSLLVGKMLEARGVRFKAVALLGLSEGSFPANEHPDPFLDENQRVSLGMEQRMQREQAGLFYQAVTRSDHYLLITRPYLSDDGENWEESTYWGSFKQMFDPGAKRTIHPDDAQPLEDAASSQELLFSAVRQKNLPKKFNFLIERWNYLQHAQEVIKARRSKIAAGPYEGEAGSISSQIRQVYPSSHIWSASRLEHYGSCPLQFYIQSALGLEQRGLPDFGLNASQRGSILHKILEETYLGSADPGDLPSDLESLLVVCKRVLHDAPVRYGFRPSSLWEYEKLQLQEKLDGTVRALAEESSWIPYAYEAKFGIDEYPALEINLGEEVILIRGVIDRIDKDQRGNFRVIDYKSGGSHLSQSDLQDGRRLQLPIYALALRDALKLGEPVEGFYWNIMSAEAGPLKLSKFKTEDAEGMEAAIAEVCRHLQRIIKGIRSAKFSPRPPRGGCVSYCPASQWCWRFDPERKI